MLHVIGVQAELAYQFARGFLARVWSFTREEASDE
jgi:hypothetical protein